MTFHFNDWLVYFYFYCIVGWIFESGNVSIRQKKWVNRGFMRGPWLPLYGSGALVILLSTLPVADKPILVYVTAAIAATVLEYITGVGMLALFKVRYWDYRYRKIQFQGHICLVSTIVWGFLGLLMVYVIHPPVVRLVKGWNQEVVSIATFLITLCIVYDFTNAFREAMDLRQLIIQAEKLKVRMDDIIEERKERIEQRIADVREQHLDNMADLEDALETLRQRMEEKANALLRRNPYASFHNLEQETEEIRRRLHIMWKK